MESFGKRLQQFRKRANLTQEEVATKLNLTAQAVSKWENDVSAPDISLLVEIAQMFGITTDELLGKQPQTTVVAEESRKSPDSMMLKLKVLCEKGDKIHLNLPLGIVKVFVNSGMAMPQLTGNDALKNVDFHQILLLCEQGVIGKLMEVNSADGDIVEIWVE